MTFKELLIDDGTPLEHAALALTKQVACLALFGWIDFFGALCFGTALAIGFYAGREHAQAERRIKNRDKKPDIDWECTVEALKFWKWDWGSQLDLYWPLITSLAFFGIAQWVKCCHSVRIMLQ